MIHQECATCGKKLAIPDKYAGTEGRCTQCGARIQVMQAPPPPPQSTTSPPPPPPPRSSVPPPPPPPATSPTSLLPPDSKWYYLEADNTIGPVFPKEMETLIKSGRITKNTSVWCGEGDWQSARDTLLAPLFTKPVDYGKILLAIPIIGLIPMLFSGILGAFFVTVSTAIIAAYEAHKVGMKTNRKNGTYGPVSWFITFIGLWIVAYPMYLYKRKYYGLPNYGIPGIAVAGIYIVALVIISVGSVYHVDLEESAAQLVTEILLENFGDNMSNCVRVTIDEEPTDGFYKATALLENGSEIAITIREMDNGEIKVLIPTNQ